MCRANCENCEIKDGKKIVYQLHLTVEECNHEWFRFHCRKQNVKNVIVKYDNISDTHIMTSSVEYSYDAAFNRLHNLAYYFEIQGVKVIRRKIETVPWNPIIVEYPNGYFETHITVRKDLCLSSLLLTLPVSYNINKSELAMLTIRQHNVPLLQHMSRVQEISDMLDNRVETFTEYAIYDDNEKLDEQWLGKNKL